MQLVVNLVSVMDRLGITPVDLSARTGIKPQHIYRMRGVNRSATLKTIGRLATALGCESHELIIKVPEAVETVPESEQKEGVLTG
jgi:DNA-binding Xre family transcriptional regulator